MSNAPNPAENAPSLPDATPRPRRFWRKKRFWIPLAIVALIFIGVYRASASKPITVSPETTVVVEPLTPDGKTVDFRKRYETAQDDWLGPPRENGFRELLAAFGPRILARHYAADSVRWEDFPTNPNEKDWFNGFWTRLCGKFELDPTARPTLLDRVELCDYLRANGIAATETDAATENSPPTADFGTVWVDFEEKPAKISAQDAQNYFERLYSAPWTADDFPTGARWLDENADRFDVYAKAINAPKFGCPHFPGDEPARGWINTLLPDVQSFRAVARNLAIRANFRVGSGDVDGAISDRRLILRLSRHILDNPNDCFVESLVGLAIFQIGVGLNVAGNPNALPTSEQLARDAENWRETFGEYDFDAAFRRTIRGERFALSTGAAFEWAALPASRKFETLRTLADASPRRDGLVVVYPRRVFSALIYSDFDADAFARRFNDVWNAAEDAAANGSPFQSLDLSEFAPELFADDPDSPTGKKPTFKSPRRDISLKSADSFLALLFPALDACREAFRRAECAAKLATLQNALLQYQAANGTFPPAFTVDENGTPLQSWRVLVLPHLGDEAAKALYAKIRLDESWDSEFNRQFQAQTPDVFRCPANRDLRDGETAFSVIVGKNALFDASGKGKNLAELAKNPERNALAQALIVERKTPVCWTRPDAELDENAAVESAEFNAESPKSTGIASFHNGGANVALANGSLQFLEPPTPLDGLILGVPEPEKSEPTAP